MRRLFTSRGLDFGGSVLAALALGCAAPTMRESPVQVIATDQTSGTNALLIAVTEKRTADDVEALVEVLTKA